MKSIKVCIACFFILSTNCFLIGQSILIDKVVGRVGSEVILLSEIEDEYSFAKSRQTEVPEDLKCSILEETVAQKLVVYQAKLDSVVVDEGEVEMQLDLRFENVLRQMNGDEAFFQEYYGATVEEMKERYRDDQRQKILAERKQQELLSEVTITPKDVETFFYKIPTDSLPYFNSEMEISEIIYVPKVNDEERKKALDKITELYNQVISGKATIGDIATKYSQDPGSAARGGDLGFAKRGSYVGEFEAAVFSLTKGQISEVIETEFGYHFIELTERRGNTVRAKHVLIKPEITDEDLKLAKNIIDSVRTAVVKDSLKFEDAVAKFSMKNLPSYSNGGRVKNPQTNNTFFDSKSLDPDTYFAVFSLKPGDISEPVEVKMPDGQTAYRLIKLNSITKPHRASLKEDYDKIAGFAKQSKSNEHFMDWVNNKMKTTYIKIDSIFNGCKIGGEVINP